MTDQTATSLRQAALAAGFALLAMTVLAPIAYFGMLGSLVVEGDAETTAQNLGGSMGMFRAVILMLLVVIVLDVVVAWGLYFLFRPLHPALSLLMAWLRLVFAALFAVAIMSLYDAAQLLAGGEAPSAQVMSMVDAFENGWTIALAVIGLHLGLLGWLLFRSKARLLGVLVGIAGLGYVVETVAKILIADFDVAITAFTFVGEAVLIVWLLWKGFKGTGLPGRPVAVVK